MGLLGAILAVLGPSWSRPRAFVGPRKGPLGATLGPLGQKHENDPKKSSKISRDLIVVWDHFGVIFGLFSGIMCEQVFE